MQNKDNYNVSELNSILFRLRTDYDKFENLQTKKELNSQASESKKHSETRTKFDNHLNFKCT